MEIAVASSSPLGQYLAELDDEGESMAHLLSAPRIKRPRRRNGRVSNTRSWLQLVQSLQRRVELVAIRCLIPELCAFHPTIREELQQVVGSDVAVDHECWWSRHVAVVQVLRGVGVWKNSMGLGGALVVILAVAAAGREKLLLLQMLGWCIAVAAFVLELSVRLLLAWYALRSRRLVNLLNEFIAALGKFNEVYAGSLTLVKRAELASRGYRLGSGLLPPIGRLEAANAEAGGNSEESVGKNQLRCLPLRRKLRTLNDQLQTRASRLVQEDEKTIGEETRDLDEIEDSVDEQAPSLLLTALAKHHNRAVLVLENAVHTLLVRNMTRACSARVSKNCSLFRTMGSQQVEVEQLIRALSVWTNDLETWNTTKDPVTPLTSDSRINSSERKQEEHQLAPSNPSDPRLKNVATQLQDLRSTSETFIALVIASQQELLLADSAPERLSSSRDAMQSMIQQVQEAWSNYNSALNELIGKENPQDMPDATEESEREESESKPSTVSASASVPALEDPNCTVVFTGTSTGDEGFDLQALLKQQEADATASSSGPTPHFVRELRDVLAHREAHAQPGLTKQVDHDPPASSTSVPNAGHEAPLPPPPAVDAMFALPRAPPRGPRRRPPPGSATLRTDREPSALISPASPTDNGLSGAVANAFNLELQALLQRAQSSQQQDDIECLGDSDGESEINAESTLGSTD